MNAAFDCFGHPPLIKLENPSTAAKSTIKGWSGSTGPSAWSCIPIVRPAGVKDSYDQAWSRGRSLIVLMSRDEGRNAGPHPASSPAREI